EIPLFAILISAMENVLLTIISANPYDKPTARHVFRESFKILSLIAFPIFFLLLTAGPEAFSIIFNNKYNASLPVFLISIFIIPVRITHYGVILQCYGQSRKIALGSVLDILFSLLLMFILYPVMGTPGVALAIVVSTYLQAWFYTWQSAKTMKLGTAGMLPGTFLIKFWLSLMALYGLLYWLKKYFNSTASLAIISAVTVVIIITGLARYWTFQRASAKK
ncbi:MAG: polysaccharide biosynthesis C-terminal domain-containing protein, partial [Ferruginibacter sp.]